MIYAATELSSGSMDINMGVAESHKELLGQFTGHLNVESMAYFREWDRLIDLEADATTYSAATPWLIGSAQRENETGECISSLVFDGAEPTLGEDVLIGLRRAQASLNQTPLSNLGFTRGCQVIISTDATSFELSQSRNSPQSHQHGTAPPKRAFRHQMHMVRGLVERTEGDRLLIRASRDDLERIRELAVHYKGLHGNSDTPPVAPSAPGKDLCFRVDKDKGSFGVGTLRQNLVNLFTADCVKAGAEGGLTPNSILQNRLSWLRDVIICLKRPEFDRSLSASLFATGPDSSLLPGCDLETLAFEYADLNPDQRSAVEQVRLWKCTNFCSLSPVRLTSFFAPFIYMKGHLREGLCTDSGTSRNRENVHTRFCRKAFGGEGSACSHNLIHACRC
jgi:hypothetical protein